MAAEAPTAHSSTGISTTLYHNPACSNSRAALALLRERGIEPVIVDYLATPPDRQTLLRLANESGLGLRGILRAKELVHDELGLSTATDAALLDAMLAHPVLINRPIVETPWGVRLCRPPEVVLEILPKA